MLFSTFSLILHYPFPHPTLLYNTLVLPIFMLRSVSGIDVFEEQKPRSVPQYVNIVDLLVMVLNLCQRVRWSLTERTLNVFKVSSMPT